MVGSAADVMNSEVAEVVKIGPGRFRAGAAWAWVLSGQSFGRAAGCRVSGKLLTTASRPEGQKH